MTDAPGAEPLLVPSDLLKFPGAPFEPGLIASVGESLRADAGWHIAPVRTQTVTIESFGGQWIFLPTLWLSEISEIRQVKDDDTTTVLDAYGTQLTERFRAGCIRRTGHKVWPYGVLEVDIVHGYAKCPADLFTAAAYRAQRASVNSVKGTVSLGSLSVTQAASPVSSGVVQSGAPDAAINRYRIPRPT